MDIFSAIIVFVPLIAPLGVFFQLDPVHLAIIFIAKGFTKLMKFVYLGLLNSLLGSLFGGLKLILILMILSKIIFSFNLIPMKMLSESNLMIQLHILSEIIFNSVEIINYEYTNNLI